MKSTLKINIVTGNIKIHFVTKSKSEVNTNNVNKLNNILILFTKNAF